MRIASITWNGDEDKTKIVFSDEFIASNKVVHLDVLSDILNAVEGLYIKTVEEKKMVIPKSINSGEVEA